MTKFKKHPFTAKIRQNEVFAIYNPTHLQLARLNSQIRYDPGTLSFSLNYNYKKVTFFGAEQNGDTSGICLQGEYKSLYTTGKDVLDIAANPNGWMESVQSKRET